MAGIVALFADDVRQETSARVYEPIAHLMHGQVRSLRQVQLFVLGRVGVVSVFVQPHLEYFDTLFGQIAASFATIDDRHGKLRAQERGSCGGRVRRQVMMVMVIKVIVVIVIMVMMIMMVMATRAAQNYTTAPRIRR